MTNNLVLSYLLAPDIFGLMALANILVIAVQMFSEVGVGPCLVQHARGEEPQFVNTAWTIQVLRGPAISLVMALLAYPLAVWYEEPRLVSLTMVLGLMPMIQCAASTAIFTVGRRLQIGRLMSLELLSQLLGCVAMCVAAWWWSNVWALVLGTFVTSLVLTLGSHLFLGMERNHFAWDREAAKQIFRFGKWIAVGTAIAFFAIQIDRLVLGKLGTLSELGLYHLAMSLATLAPMTVGRLAGVVQFPLLSEAARDSTDSLRVKLAQTRRPLLYAGLLMSLSGVVAGPLFFAYLYEERYRQAGSIVQVMFVATWFAVLSKTVDRALVALGDTRSTAIITFVGFVACLAGTVVGYHFAGINGFCLGVGFGAIINHLMLYPAIRSHGLSCFTQDLCFSLVAFLFAALIYGVQNAPLLGAVGERLALPVEMLGHWLVLVVFSLAVLWFLLMSGRALLARPSCNG